MRSNANPNSHFPSRLKTARESKGISQRALAKAVGSSSAAMSEFESGKRFPSMKLVQRLATELGVSVDFLLGHPTSEENYPAEVEELAKLAALLSKDEIHMLVVMTRALVAEKFQTDREIQRPETNGETPD